MKARMYLRIGAVAVACATAGTLAGIATSSAKTTKKVKATTNQGATGPTGSAGMPGPRRRGMGPGGGAVHSVSVVPNQAGTGFDTITQDSGTITSVDATNDTITIDEGTSSTTYQDLTVTVPASATIYLDGASSTLDKLAAKDHVNVIQSSAGTFTVMAGDGSAPAGGSGSSSGGGFGGPGGGGGRPGPGGPGGAGGGQGAPAAPGGRGGPPTGATGTTGWTGPQQ